MLPGEIIAEPSRASAIAAVAELLGKLRTEFAFVGTVARAAWLGEPVAGGAVDVLGTISAEGRHQVPMMAMNRGFLIDERALDAAQELDLVPLVWPAGGQQVRVHVLIASNALYGRMVRDAVAAPMEEHQLRVVTAEDLALLLMLGEDSELTRLTTLPGFDAEAFNSRLQAIGLGMRTIPG